MTKKNHLLAAGILAVAAVAAVVVWRTGNRPVTEEKEYSEEIRRISSDTESYGYTQAREAYAAGGYQAGADRICLTPGEAVLTGDAVLMKSEGYEHGGEMIYSGEEENTVEWSFRVEKGGLYRISMDYIALDGNGAKIQRQVLIDGELPFEEAAAVSFYRVFREGEVTVNSIGDQVWPVQTEDMIWQHADFEDGQGYFEDPLLFYLEEGEHTLSLEQIDQPVGIGNVTICPPEDIPSYARVLEEYEAKGYRETSGICVKLQAEDSSWRNDSVVRRESNVDPNAEPYSLTSRLLNTVGGYRWRTGNQSVAWEIQVPESGLYTIRFKVAQTTTSGIPSYRRITIDGSVPFEELKLYRFDYNKNWYGETLSDEEGEPYLFYLEAGVHELKLEVKLGDFTEVIERTVDDLQYLSDLTREITKITGTDPDPNYEYELYRNMPELGGKMGYVADRLEYTISLLASVSNETTSMENNYRSIVDMLRKFEKDVDTIPRALTELDSALANLGTYITDIQICPLCLDYLEVASADVDFKVKKTLFTERLWATTVNFVMSFFKDYDSIGKTTEETGEEQKVLDVWIARGADWGELLKEMADERFTPETGIVVNVNVIPSGQLSTGSVNMLMLSVTSGDAPDVALSVDYNLPSEFAFRGAAVDLTQFEGYEELAAQYYDTMFEPYRFEGGVYAFPETMDFTCMIYRTDIMGDLGLKIPETWDELLETVLPTLYENSMTFAFPVDTTVSTTSPGAYRGYTMLLLQKGGSYYSNDLRSSALDSAVAYDAFKMWTSLYTNYDVDEQSNFFTRMRTGTQPIGIGNYATYLQLLTSAPELYGRWAIAPVPGTVQEDGSVNNIVGTISSTSCMILEQSDKQQEAWQFLQWWLSEETQVSYGRQLEALLGTGSRWNTANREAFYSLPWKKADEEVIQASLETAVEQPIVPGGYFTGRHIINAWNRVCINNDNVRDALEKAVKDIDREIATKRKEFGLD